MQRFTKITPRKVLEISRIVTILYFKFPKNFVFTGERHGFWEFIYVDKGEILISADSRQYCLKAGELAFHRPGEFHTVKADGVLAPHVFVTSFECDSPAMKRFEKKILRLSDEEKSILAKLLAEGQTCYEKKDAAPPIHGMNRKKSAPFGAEQMVKLLLEQLLISIYRSRDSILKSRRSRSVQAKVAGRGLTMQILAILEANLTKPLSLEEISQSVGYSVSHIKGVFKADTGKSIMDYFLGLKTEEAKIRIKEGSQNITQIADALGFQNVYYFSRFFKQKTGMTPTEFSKAIGE